MLAVWFELHSICIYKQCISVSIHLPGSFICSHFSNPGKIVVRYIIESMKRRNQTAPDLFFLSFHVYEKATLFVFQETEHISINCGAHLV